MSNTSHAWALGSACSQTVTHPFWCQRRCTDAEKRWLRLACNAFPCNI